MIADWCRERKIAKPLLQISELELNEALRRFYAEARNKNGGEYSRSSLLGFRSAVERHFAANDVQLKLTNNPIFQKSNKMFECKLKVNRREAKENIQHKPVIEPADIRKMSKSPFLSHNNPAGLLRRVWFIVALYWCRRGSEGQRELRRDSFAFNKTADSRQFATMSHEEATKNHQGGISDKPSNEKQTRLYSTGQFGDSFWCLKKYISLLNPKQEAFFQNPKPTISSDDAMWYENKPLGLNKLSTMMKEISLGAGLSKTYTNHCVRATAITIWSDAEIPARHIMNISGHASEQSIASYNTRPSVQQLEKCSDILSSALITTERSSEAHRVMTETMTSTTSLCTAATPTTSIELSSAAMSFNSLPNTIFNSCNIGNANIYVLPQSNSRF